jgi:hypothetical protein
VSDIDKLRAFAQAVLDGWPDVPQWDGFDLQDLAVKHGLLEATTVTEFCGEGCQCAEVNEFPMECFRFTALLKGPTLETCADPFSIHKGVCQCPTECREARRCLHPQTCEPG